MGFIKKYTSDKIAEFKQDWTANREIRKKERTAYYQAKEKAAIDFAKKKAQYQQDEKLKRLKSGGTGFFGSFAKPSSVGSKAKTTAGPSFANIFGGTAPATTLSAPKYKYVKVQPKRKAKTKRVLVNRREPKQYNGMLDFKF